jgi:hypothetical protein
MLLMVMGSAFEQFVTCQGASHDHDVRIRAHAPGWRPQLVARRPLAAPMKDEYECEMAGGVRNLDVTKTWRNYRKWTPLRMGTTSSIAAPRGVYWDSRAFV